jgi:glucose-1-phosphate cytidylyltransferase
MKVVLLAGGRGTRIADYTGDLPKPMVRIGGKPILWHIMSIYAFFGHKEFFLALGYKAEKIKEYFLTYRTQASDVTIDLRNGEISAHQESEVDWRVTLVDTGLDSMTGGRVKRMQKWIGNETFLLSYGDGLANINVKDLIKFHRSHGKLVTVTGVRPSARFGELKITSNNQVSNFREKPQVGQGWINGGFFVIEPEFFDFIEGDHTILEQEPLEEVARAGELMSYKHTGFWQCMDTRRDKDSLEELCNRPQAPWVWQ